MVRRTRRHPPALALIGVAYVVVAVAVVWASSPYRLVGFAVDGALTIGPGSALPSNEIREGDRIVAVDRQPVASARELGAVLARTGNPQVPVVVEQRNRRRTVTLSARRFEEQSPEELFEAHGVWRVDGQQFQSPIPVAELEHFIAAAAPTPIEVEYELQRRQVEGPAVVRRGAPSALTMAWLVLGFLALGGVALLGARRLNRADAAPQAVVAAGLGGLACAALATAATSPGGSASFVVAALALFALWRGAAAADRGGKPIALWGAAAVAFGLVAAGALAARQDVVAARIDAVGQLAAVATVLLLGWTAVEVSDPRATLVERVLRGAGAAVGAIVAGVATLALGAEAIDGATVALVFAGSMGWAADTSAVARRLAGGADARVGRGDTMSLREALAEVAGVVPDETRVCAYVGADSEFVRVSVRVLPTGAVLATEHASEAWATVLSMLATEGGMFPRPQRYHGSDHVEDDPFADVGDRLGLIAAAPISTDAAQAVVAFLAVERASDAEAAPFVDVAAFAEAVESLDERALHAELAALYASAALSRARTLSRARGEGGAPSSAPRDSLSTSGASSAVAAPEPATTRALAPVNAPPLTARPTASSSTPMAQRVVATGASAQVASPAGDDDASRWAAHLTELVQRRYPVEDRDALDDREWLALAFLRDTVKPALIVGEPGVGKEFVARAVHAAMWGETRRFVVLDCSLRPPSVVEDELFGDDDEPGLVAVVGEGTLLLKQASTLGDERLVRLVPRLVATRARLVFAERYRGAETGVPSTVSKAIRAAVEERRIHLSPLRERPDDVARFASMLLLRTAMRYDLAVTEIGDDAEDFLGTLDLPANFTELDALVTAAALRCTGRVLRRGDFGDAAAGAAPGVEAPAQTSLDLSEVDADGDRERIVEALREAGDNRTRAAELLGISRGKLLRRLKKFGLE